MAPLDCLARPLSTTDHKRITYRFFAASNATLTVEMFFEKKTFRLTLPEGSPHPDWAKLAFNRCPNCTLPKDAAYCPAALGIANFLPAFESRVSHEKAVIEVESGHRTIVSKSTFQTGMASMIGLVCATSGCPLTKFLRPMARFHLPFADEQETLFRSFATWLLMSLVRQRSTGDAEPITLEGLKDNYRALSVMNTCLGNRIRNSVSRDAALNAVVILDLFAQIAPDNIDGDFEDIMEAFVVEEE